MRGRPESERHLGTISGWTGIRCGRTDHHSSGYLGTVDHSPLDYGAVDYHGGPPAHGRRRGRGIDLRPHPVQRL